MGWVGLQEPQGEAQPSEKAEEADSMEGQRYYCMRFLVSRDERASIGTYCPFMTTKQNCLKGATPRDCVRPGTVQCCTRVCYAAVPQCLSYT